MSKVLKVYSAFPCIFKFDSHSVFDITAKRRRFSSKSVILTEAQKQLMICHLPQVLRLHLKRFRLVVVVVQLHTFFVCWFVCFKYFFVFK